MGDKREIFVVTSHEPNSSGLTIGDIVYRTKVTSYYKTIYSTHPRAAKFMRETWYIDEKDLMALSNLTKLEKLIYNIRD